MSRFEAAVARFESAHREDPRKTKRHGAEQPWSLVYHERLAAWLDRLAPDASEPLRLAARCQHLYRWAIPRNAFKPGVAGYKRWRSTLARRHAEDAGRILAESGYDEPTIARVRDLLVKKGLGSDPEVQRFEDAICLTFVELELEGFAAEHDAAKVIDVLRKTWKKMSGAGHAAALELAATLPPGLRVLVDRARGAL